jgi:hypothetical protein
LIAGDLLQLLLAACVLALLGANVVMAISSSFDLRALFIIEKEGSL